MPGADCVHEMKPSAITNFGYRLFGLCAICFGCIALVWPGREPFALAYLAAGLQIAGGISLQFRRSAKTGAVVLFLVYLADSFVLVPKILATPRVFDPWGDFFEAFTLVVGAALAYVVFSPARVRERGTFAGRLFLAICTLSFGLYQLVHLDVTAGLVPAWMPPNRMFWAEATTVAFGLAAVALAIDKMTLLATRLLALMLLVFGACVWVPVLVAKPRNHGDWSETVLTFAIAGTAWILADLIAG